MPTSRKYRMPPIQNRILMFRQVRKLLGTIPSVILLLTQKSIVRKSMTSTSSSNKIITQYSLTKINQLICFLIKQFVKSRLYEPKCTISSALKSMVKTWQNCTNNNFNSFFGCIKTILRRYLFPKSPNKLKNQDSLNPRRYLDQRGNPRVFPSMLPFTPMHPQLYSKECKNRER